MAKSKKSKTFRKSKKSRKKKSIDMRKAVRDFNEYMHGTPYPIHSYKHGYLDMGNRRDRAMMDGY